MNHGNQLELERCPHCNIANPHLGRVWAHNSANHGGGNKRHWACYGCVSCGGLVLACSSHDQNHPIHSIWPAPQAVAEVVPARAKEFLEQAIASLHAPAGAVMLAASSVDAMLKDKGYKEGSLNTRIDKAATDHLITAEMGAWAHDVRLDANDQRHADEAISLPSAADATKAIEFANALAQFLYVLPARVERGRKA
jgi:hypothetical protein